MRIQHNISAINANRNLGTNQSSLSKSLEKLSSGYKINRAGDNAAGLAISEKMRAQITCLTQAETNCNDGVSLIQTAEGALQEVHSMLNRMTELAEQSANGTYQDDVDRENLEDELSQLKTEITRVSKATNFNGITLLDGSLNKSVSNDDLKNANIKMSVKNGGNLGTSDNIKVTVAANGAVTFGAISGATASKYTTETKSATGKGVYTVKINIKDSVKESTATADKELVEKWDGVEITVDTTKSTATAALASKVAAFGSKGNLQLQIGDTADKFNQLNVQIEDMSAKGLGIDGVHVSSLDSATTAIATIKDAINTVSSTRGNLGAMQNRLEHTINNLSTTNENITNAESRIRDTDMAKEMMTFTSKSILSQAAQSMLAQANQQPQQVLSLLQ